MFHVKQKRVAFRCSAGACLLCRRLPLPLVCLSAPIPPTPFPAGRGRFFCFLMQGAPPLAFPGLNPRGTGYFLPCQCFFAPIPRPPSQWEGGDQSYFMQGASPLASPGLNPRGTGSIGGAGAPGTPAAKPARHWLFLPRQCFSVPIPPTPFPAGRGRPKLFHARGSAPCIPGPGLSPGGTGSIGGGWRPGTPCG